MTLTAAALDGMADWLADAAPYIALHTGPTAAELTAANRVLANWTGSLPGQLLTQSRAFAGGTPNGPLRYVGLWSAATGGVFHGSFALDADSDLIFNANGEYVLNRLELLVSSSPAS